MPRSCCVPGCIALLAMLSRKAVVGAALPARLLTWYRAPCLCLLPQNILAAVNSLAAPVVFEYRTHQLSSPGQLPAVDGATVQDPPVAKATGAKKKETRGAAGADATAANSSDVAALAAGTTEAAATEATPAEVAAAEAAAADAEAAAGGTSAAEQMAQRRLLRARRLGQGGVAAGGAGSSRGLLQEAETANSCPKPKFQFEVQTKAECQGGKLNGGKRAVEVVACSLQATRCSFSRSCAIEPSFSSRRQQGFIRAAQLSRLNCREVQPEGRRQDCHRVPHNHHVRLWRPALLRLQVRLLWLLKLGVWQGDGWLLMLSAACWRSCRFARLNSGRLLPPSGLSAHSITTPNTPMPGVVVQVQKGHGACPH